MHKTKSLLNCESDYHYYSCWCIRGFRAIQCNWTHCNMHVPIPSWLSATHDGQEFIAFRCTTRYYGTRNKPHLTEFWAQLLNIAHTLVYISLTYIIDAAYSVLDLLQVYHHVDGRVLDSAVARILLHSRMAMLSVNVIIILHSTSLPGWKYFKYSEDDYWKIMQGSQFTCILKSRLMSPKTQHLYWRPLFDS